MKVLKIMVFWVLAAFTASCDKEKEIEPSGPVTTVEKSFSDFSSIQSANGFELDITFGNIEKVVVETYENLQPYIEIRQTGNKICIQRAEDVEFDGNPAVKIHIYAKAISDLNTSGGTRTTVNNVFETENLNAVISGGGSFNAYLSCGNFTSNLTGGSSVNLSGTANKYTLTSSGGSKSDGFDFVVNEFNCSLSGGSNVNISVNNKLSVTASGGSTVNYKGEGSVIHSNLTGGSAINKIGYYDEDGYPVVQYEKKNEQWVVCRKYIYLEN